jgi:hypothetical protein
MRYIVGKSESKEWAVIDTVDDRIKAGFDTKEEAQEAADRAERGEDGPPEEITPDEGERLTPQED